jgi:fucose permease
VSSLLVMAILGGALLPPLQGWIADNTACKFLSSCRSSRMPTSLFTAPSATRLGAKILQRHKQRQNHFAMVKPFARR